MPIPPGTVAKKGRWSAQTSVFLFGAILLSADLWTAHYARFALPHEAVPVSRLESDAHWETAQCPLLALSGHVRPL
jgi:hypothetical protein